MRRALPILPALAGAASAQTAAQTAAPSNEAQPPAAMAPGTVVPPTMVSPALPTMVNLNTASAAELDALPGVGPSLAEAIIRHRPYANAEEALSKGAVPRAVFERIRDRVVTATVNVNAASPAELDALPGIGPVLAEAIVRHRPYASLEELTSRANVPRPVVERMRGVATVQ